jgi:hypothetical protein
MKDRRHVAPVFAFGENNGAHDFSVRTFAYATSPLQARSANERMGLRGVL